MALHLDTCTWLAEHKCPTRDCDRVKCAEHRHALKCSPAKLWQSMTLPARELLRGVDSKEELLRKAEIKEAVLMHRDHEDVLGQGLARALGNDAV